MKYVGNMLWMAGGIGVGMMLQSKSKDIKKMMKKGKKMQEKMTNQIYSQMKNN